MTNEKRFRDFTIIHNSIIRSEILSVYEKSFINNILSNEDGYKIALSTLSKRIPCSRDKCIKIANTLKERKILSVSRNKTLNGDWDSNSYKLDLNMLFDYIGVVVEKDNVVFNNDYLVFEKDNGSIPERQQVVVEKDNKNTIKNTNKNINNKGYDAILNSYTQNQTLKDTLLEFIKMRKAIKKPMTDRALSLLLKKLSSLANDDENKIKIVEQSILHSWQSVFQLKEAESSYENKLNPKEIETDINEQRKAYKEKLKYGM